MKHLIIILLLLTSLSAYSQTSNFLIGKWFIKSKNITIEVKKVNNLFEGYITESKNQQNIGAKVIWNLSFNNSNKEWSDGILKLPDMNHSANCIITYKNQNEVTITGYHGLRLFGETVTAIKL